MEGSAAKSHYPTGTRVSKGFNATKSCALLISSHYRLEKLLECIDIDTFLALPERFRQRFLADILSESSEHIANILQILSEVTIFSWTCVL